MSLPRLFPALRRPLTTLAAPVLLALVAIAAMAVPQHALACGGCVAPPLPTDSPLLVKQSGERILFVRDDIKNTSTVHIEIRYTGLAKDFGWVLPLPQVPKVSVGSDLVFRQLDGSTRPRFQLTQDYNPENCRDRYMGCTQGPDGNTGTDGNFGWDSVSQDSASSGGGQPPPVQVLASGEAGPFLYQVLAAKESGPLLKWLEDNGYSLPPQADAIVQSHLTKGDVFVAIKLQNGQGIESIRPIVLEMPGAEACVPLRLTSIAAVEDMDVQVFLVGTGRAIPKNMLHVEPNPVVFSWQTMQWNGINLEPANYEQMLSAAIDEADGAGFVTEFAKPAGQVQNLTAEANPLVYQAQQVNSLQGLANWIATALSVTSGQAVVYAVDETTDLPEQLSTTAENLVKFLPYCHSPFFTFGPGAGASDAVGSVSGVVDCLVQQLGSTPQQLQAATVNGTALTKHVEDLWLKPLQDVQTVLDNTQVGNPWLTRMRLRIDPTEMDRDPLFGFNVSLPAVERNWQATRRPVCTDGWEPPEATRWSFADIGSWVVEDSETVGKNKKAPAALWIELLDEQGPAMIIASAQAPQVAAAIASAVPGKDQLPPGFVIVPGSAWQPPASDSPYTQAGPWQEPLWCTPKPGWENGKMPPEGEILDPPDAGELDVNGIDTWRSVEDGTGTDTGGGLADTTGGGGGGSKTAAKSDGCTAGHVPAGSAWPLLLVLGLWVGWRRDRSRVSLTLVSSKR